jgi:hypothetical protein
MAGMRYATGANRESTVQFFVALTLAAAAEPGAPPVAPVAPDLSPAQGVLLSIDAYGKLVAGNVVVDTQKLGGMGITLFQGQAKVAQKIAPLADGLRVVGLPKGERIVEGAVDTLMYFDANGDTYLDALDPAFAAFAVFDDRNGDERIQSGEVRMLVDLGVDSISRFGSIRMKER